MLTVNTIPLNCLVPSEANVRRNGQSLRIEELAASIHAHGLPQNLTVRIAPAEKRTTKKRLPYEVIAGGRRLAALKLLAKRKLISPGAPIACHILTDENATEISLAENALQCPMHPADQFDAFFALHNDHGLVSDEIAARFGVTAAVVRQRLKLAAVSPVLMQAYRDEKLDLDQLSAFAITDDHAKQEQVWENCDGDERREDILAALNGDHVPADDRRAQFVGIEAYQAAGGAILRDLFDDEGGGFLTDPDLLNGLVEDKLESIAEGVKAEGWHWVEVLPRFDYAATADLRRIYPKPVPLSDEDQARIDALEAEYEALEENGDEDALQAEAERIEQAIEALRGEAEYDPDMTAMAGVIISLDYHGEARIERGFVRREDDKRHAETKPRAAKAGPAPLSAALAAELTAYRTLGLQEVLGRQPQFALIAVTHALAAGAFFPCAPELSCLQIKTRQASLASHVRGIDETPTGERLGALHEAWAKRMPEEPGALWDFVTGLDEAERMALLAHCTSLTIDAVQTPQASGKAALAHADQLAGALGLDMRAHWQPTAAGYFSRVSRERILEAVREGVSPQAADNLAKLKKGALAETAEQRMKDSGWLPPLLRANEATNEAAQG